MRNDFELLQMHYPLIAKNVVEHHANGKHEFILTLADGSKLSYDTIWHTIRNLPNDRNSMTEKECRTEFGSRLRVMLYLKGLTQQDLSEMTGITQATISHYITGKATPSLYTADKIARCLGCTIEDFLYT